MTQVNVLLLARNEGGCYLGFFIPVFGNQLVDIDGAVFTVEALQRFHDLLVQALAGDDTDVCYIREGNARLAKASGEWWLYLGGMAVCAFKDQLEQMATNMEMYIDSQMVTDANASPELLAMREGYRAESG